MTSLHDSTPGQSRDRYGQRDRETKTFVQISILTIGAMDARKNVSSGSSDVNGKWIVEEIDREDCQVRQLVFDSNTSLIQSEAFLKSGFLTSGSSHCTASGVKDKWVLDTEQLACTHHYMMLASLALHASQPLRNIANSELKITVLGLGGGLLATFLLQHFPRVAPINFPVQLELQITLTAVELDKEMVTVATKHFGFPGQDKRVTVKVMDALTYLEQTAVGSKS